MSDTVTIRGRIASVCARAPFRFTEAVQPFDFELQPSGVIDEVFRIEAEALSVIGGFNYSEDRTDMMRIWLARKHRAAPEVSYRRLLTDASSLRAAIIRDGVATSGDYSVPDSGEGVRIVRDDGQEYAVLQMSIPVNYETSV